MLSYKTGFLSVLVLSVSLPFSLNTSAAPPFVPGQIVVKGDPIEFSEYSVTKRLRRSDLTVLEVGAGNERAAIMRLRGKGRWAAFNLLASKSAIVDDSFRIFQWHFDRIQANQAWDLSTGANVTVAVLDTGLSQGPDGVNDVCDPIDIVNEDSNPADGDGHGTHVSGTIAQNSNNGTGVAGLAYSACIMPVKVLDDTGSGSFSDIAEGIYHAVDKGAEVINMSLGINARYGVTSDPVMDPALQYAADNDVIVVAASGNDGYRKNVSYPAIYPTVIAVGSTDARDRVVRYSNRGAGLDLVAPGGDTSRDDNGDGYVDGVLQETDLGEGHSYYFFQGTSMASPHVAAAAALLISHGAQPSEVRGLLQDNTKDIVDSGFDTASGWGLIQAYDALSAVNQPSTGNPPDADFTFSCSDYLCNFDAQGSNDTDGDIISYIWDFGDGTTDTTTTDNIAHTYAATGFFNVTLTVEDNEGMSDSLSQTVTIEVAGGSCTDADGDGVCVEDGDCDDSNPDVYPGHGDRGKRWGRDGIDNDCDGIADR